MSYRCPHCNKPTAASAAKCVHCGNALRAAVERGDQIDCPRCRTAMVVTRFGPVAIDLCQSCGGIWFDRKELDQFKRLSNEQQVWGEVRDVIDTLVQITCGVDTALYPPCPVCGEPMSSSRQQGSHAVFWRCVSHGTWADRDDAVKLIRLLDEVGEEELARRAGREQADKLSRRLQQIEAQQKKTDHEVNRLHRRTRLMWFFDLFD